MPESTGPTITLGGRSFAIAPLRLGRMKKLRRELKVVMDTKDLPKTEMPDEIVIDAYAALVTNGVCAADPATSPEAIRAVIDELSPFEGLADLAIAAADVLSLSLGDTAQGEAKSPSIAPESEPTSSTSTASTG